jgi:hypothetical protein
MKAKVVVLALGVVAGGITYAGYCAAETVHFHLGGPISSASPSVNTEAGTGNTPHKITFEHLGILMVQGWPVNLPYPECRNVIVDALRQNLEVYVADKDRRAAMRKAFDIQRTTPPPQPREVQQAIVNVIPEAPEVQTEQPPPPTDEPAQEDTARPGERMPPFLERAPN